MLNKKIYKMNCKINLNLHQSLAYQINNLI